MQKLEPYGATSSGGAGAVKRCGSDSSYFDLMFNIKKTGFKTFLPSSRLRLRVKILMRLWSLINIFNPDF
jgi:hypothetical protein